MRNDGINDVLMWISKLMPWSVAGEAYSKGWPRLFADTHTHICITYVYICLFIHLPEVSNATWGRESFVLQLHWKPLNPQLTLLVILSGASKLLVWLIPCIPVLTSQVWSLDNPGSPWWWLPNCTTSGVTQEGRPLGSKSLKEVKEVAIFDGQVHVKFTHSCSMESTSLNLWIPSKRKSNGFLLMVTLDFRILICVDMWRMSPFARSSQVGVNVP